MFILCGVFFLTSSLDLMPYGKAYIPYKESVYCRHLTQILLTKRESYVYGTRMSHHILRGTVYFYYRGIKVSDSSGVKRIILSPGNKTKQKWVKVVNLLLVTFHFMAILGNLYKINASSMNFISLTG